jgi:hypothetical protein
MNQQQRELLIKHIEKSHRAFLDKLKESKPKAPSLNNYLVAAVLSGEFELQDLAVLHAHIHRKVINLGSDYALVKGRDRYSDDENQVTLAAESLFVLPTEYVQARADYETALADYKRQIEQAEADKETLILRVQMLPY